MALSVKPVNNPTLVRGSNPAPKPLQTAPVVKPNLVPAKSAPKVTPKVVRPIATSTVQQPWEVDTAGSRAIAVNNRGPVLDMGSSPLQGAPVQSGGGAAERFVNSLLPLWRAPMVSTNDPRNRQVTETPGTILDTIRRINSMRGRINNEFEPYDTLPIYLERRTN